MSDHLDALDKLDRARHLIEAAQMAVIDIDDERQRLALDTVLYLGLTEMAEGLDILKRSEPQRMTGGERNG